MAQTLPKFWLISDRDDNGTGSGPNREGLNYFVSYGTASTDINEWEKVSAEKFQKLLVSAAARFPALPPERSDDQSHVSLLLHGYNQDFKAAVSFYSNLCSKLFEGKESLGLCILYDWPSVGSLLGYLPDRKLALDCAADLAAVLSTLYDWLVKQQQDAASAASATLAGRKSALRPCKAKVSIIAHSMGNYLLQKAMHSAWNTKNQPQLASLINQLVMVAADVDNDVFDAGSADYADGIALINLSYRITALYSGRDAALGSSAGIKHFGTRRLGRSGLANRPPKSDSSPATDNVWDVDCSSFFDDFKTFSIPGLGSVDIHGAYFVDPDTIALMRDILRGVDRKALESLGLTHSNTWPPVNVAG